MGKLVEKEFKTDVGKINLVGDVLIFFLILFSLFSTKDDIKYWETIFSIAIFFLFSFLCMLFVFAIEYLLKYKKNQKKKNNKKNTVTKR